VIADRPFARLRLAEGLLLQDRMRLAWLAIFALSGCTLYFGDDGASDDDACLVRKEPVQELRDPVTGACSGVGGGCGPGGYIEADWAACYGACEGLDQPSCEASAGCRAIFVDTCPTCDALFLSYAACWGTAPSGPVQGDCNGLDAQACSEHDDCSAVHAQVEAPGGDGGFTNGIGDFEWCQPELSPTPFACGDQTCVPGQYCSITYPGIPDAPITYACGDVPADCAGTTDLCACLANGGVCASACTYDANGDLTASCYLP
jgi:hypothetical protein